MASAARTRFKGIRAVDRLVVHGEHLSFRELCAAAVPPTTRYLVLDLDRTLHLARNMGELLGWEIGALQTYGADHLERVESRRKPGRYFDPSRPLALSKYLLRGARCWAYPGLFYLLWGRIANSLEASRRLRYQRFGTDPYNTLQLIPQLALMHELAGMPLSQARAMAARILDRHADDEVIDRDDIAWLRQRCPGIQIILSSASPQPMVEAATQALELDACEYLEIEVHDGRMSSPFQLSRLFLHEKQPHRLCPPSRFRANGGRAKLDRLLERFPDMRDASVETVGITDTWHGDDHCWAGFFTRVIDINSKTPFPPLVAAESPLREIHSARVLTRREREARSNGEPSYLDPRRRRHFDRAVACELDRAEIDARLVDIAPTVKNLAAQRARLELAMAAELDALDSEAHESLARIEDVVAAYNAADRSGRGGALNALYELLRAHAGLARARARLQRPVSEIAFDLSQLLQRSRAVFDVPPTTPQLDAFPHRDLAQV